MVPTSAALADEDIKTRLEFTLERVPRRPLEFTLQRVPRSPTPSTRQPAALSPLHPPLSSLIHRHERTFATFLLPWVTISLFYSFNSLSRKQRMHVLAL